MSRCEKAIITVLCLIYQENRILLQDRVKKDWQGMTLPGGHVEKGESFVKAVIREMQEETGLTIYEPKLCGVKQFQTDDDERYLVLLYKTDHFEGELISSEEGKMIWVNREELPKYPLVDDFMELLKVFDSEEYSEFMYERKFLDRDWIVNLY